MNLLGSGERENNGSAGKGSKEPVIDPIRSLLMVVGPELPFGTDEFRGSKLPHINCTDNLNL